MKIKTPYYLIDENRLVKNLKVIERVRKQSGAKCLLALKCFASFCVFGLIRKYMDGTTSSSLYEARLGFEKFGKETHVYSAAFSGCDIRKISNFADKIIFNSVSQLEEYYPVARKRAALGLRINPGISYSHYDLADPCRRFSRLGEGNIYYVKKALPLITGAMFHFNCENSDFGSLSKSLDRIEKKYKHILKRLEWVSLGGGIYFTKKDYPVDKFCQRIKQFADRFEISLYLEPGESVVTGCTELVTSVLDIVRNKIDIAIVDSSIEAHMLDLLIYRTDAKKAPSGGMPKHRYMIAGCSCLAGDVFGTYSFGRPLRKGSIVKFADAGGYTIVKKNWFNGIQMPSIAIKGLNNRVRVIKKFHYDDFVNGLS